MTRAAVWSINKELGEEDIRDALFPVPKDNMEKDHIINRSIEEGINLPEIMKKVAVHYLERGLSEKNGNRTKTAKVLGLNSYQTLTNWLKRYGLI